MSNTDLKKTSHSARKRFGQNFLSDQQIIQEIIHRINPKPDEIICEIGPGLGALTQHLLQANNNLITLELDKDLVEHLKKEFPSINIVQGDALKTDFSSLLNKDNDNDRKIKFTKIVGNLPYNISTPLLFHLLTFKECCDEMYFMLQKEVVDRMAASPNNKTYGRLSVMMQYHCDIEPLFNIPPHAFQPAPKVESSLVRITPRLFPVEARDVNLLSQLVGNAFNQRRKTLRNALKKMYSEDLSFIPEAMQSLRAENISVEDYVLISNHLAEKIQVSATPTSIES